MPALDPIAIGKRLELLRESRSLSQRQLAKESGVAQSAISDFEQGKRVPTMKALEKLLRFFDIEPSELMATTKLDPRESKRQFLIRHIQDQLQLLPLDELLVMAQIIDKLFQAARNRAAHYPTDRVFMDSFQERETPRKKQRPRNPPDSTIEQLNDTDAPPHT